MCVSWGSAGSWLKSASAASLSVFVLALSSGTSSAALVTYNFTGVWDIYNYSPGGLGYQSLDPATVGATFSGTVTLDTSYPDSHPGPYHGQYITPPGYPGAVTLDFGRHDNASSHYTASLSSVYKNAEYPNGLNDAWGDVWYAATSYGWPQTIDGEPVAGGRPIANTTLQLNLILGNQSDDSILPDPYSTYASSYVLLLLHGGNFVLDPWEGFAGRLTSFTPAVPQVPLPAAFPLLAAGLGALGFAGFRRKRKAVSVA